MKLTKSKLKEIIREVLEEVEQQDTTKLKSGTMSQSARTRASRGRITGDSAEVTGQEQNIIDQLEQFVSNLAGTPGVDLAKARPLLQRVLKLLQQQVGKSATQPNQGAQG
tara:strand:- start:452 stop:781 length:330 start_codon:yes stop_codon:yes gene_type:complete